MNALPCPLCDQPVSPALLAWADRLDPAVGAALMAAHPGWTPAQGVCPACVQQAFDALRADGGAGADSALADAVSAVSILGPLLNDHTVRFLYQEPAETVALTADFNGWQPGAHPFHYLGTGLWLCMVQDLAPGRYRYKLLVDGMHWEADARNSYQEPDGYCGVNSVIEVT